ncbi:MAG: hypothetical protein M2R45_00918 [Verrucomicrobia subdivision 3 bacterium]|nr:hypothetical protein [Limisphaerales bacterium]MCS1414587.1 hypothetical protein [Limisphaerales bacterium]
MQMLAFAVNVTIGRRVIRIAELGVLKGNLVVTVILVLEETK